MMSAQFIVAVTSSLTTALILFILRQVYKARKAITKLADEHVFLLRSMNLVLAHLDLEKRADEYRRKR
jgi:hypothetical protein